MSEQSHRVRVEHVDWLTLLPFLRLFYGFRMAIQPSKLLLALMLVVLVYVGGLALDLAWGPSVYPSEFQRYQVLDTAQFQNWLSLMDQARQTDEQRRDRAASPELVPDQRAGIFETLLKGEVDAFGNMIVSASSLDFGIGPFLAGQRTSHGVLGSLDVMIVAIPSWLYSTHPAFLAVFLLYGFLLLAIFGGAISRQAALQASDERRPGPFAAARFVGKRFHWFILAPLIPLAVAAVIGLVLAIGGAILFNFPVLEVVGALLFGLLLLGGLVIAVLLIGLLLGANLLFPAMAVEGTDAFDAITRAYNYIIGRPWRYLFYEMVMVVYGAVTYLFVGLVIFMTLWVTKACVGLWAVREMAPGQTRFDAILPSPQFGQLLQAINWSSLEHASTSGMIAAAIVLVWVKLLIALLPAYAVSFFFCEQTWIYLLLRRSADRTEVDEVFREADEITEPTLTPDKVEPVAAGEPVP